MTEYHALLASLTLTVGVGFSTVAVVLAQAFVPASVLIAALPVVVAMFYLGVIIYNTDDEPTEPAEGGSHA